MSLDKLRSDALLNDDIREDEFMSALSELLAREEIPPGIIEMAAE